MNKGVSRNLSAKLAPAIAICFAQSGCTGDHGPEPSVPTFGSAIKGSLSIDGSTTIFPVAQAMAEDFGKDNPGASPTVNGSGTGSGFQKFERGELDIAAASRPIEQAEAKSLQASGIEYIEIPIGYDGVSVVVNPANTWVTSLTIAELKKAWNSKSTVQNWSDIRPNFPKEKVIFHSPTDNHGTFEYFTTAIDGKDFDIREDCQRDQEYTPIIHAVSADKDAIAYVGFNYYDQNRDKVKVVPIDSGQGPVAPSAETIANGTYTPLSRPLFLYVNKKSYDTKPQVKAFVQFALSPKGENDVKESSYVVFPKEIHDAILKHVANEKTGTLFAGFTPGTKLSDLYGKVAGK
jgi:phosphate transport system substrate-binding protein